MPCNYEDYSDNFKELSRRKITEAGYQCQGSPKNPDCSYRQGDRFPSGELVVLALCHYDHDRDNNADENLKVWCQVCHIMHDKHQHLRTRRKNRIKKTGQLELFPTQ